MGFTSHGNVGPRQLMTDRDSIKHNFILFCKSANNIGFLVLSPQVEILHA